jgi:hypothetical protein
VASRSAAWEADDSSDDREDGLAGLLEEEEERGEGRASSWGSVDEGDTLREGVEGAEEDLGLSARAVRLLLLRLLLELLAELLAERLLTAAGLLAGESERTLLSGETAGLGWGRLQ